jgi:hypothetical protein
VSSTLCDSAWTSSMVSNRRPFSFNFIYGKRKKSQGAKSPVTTLDKKVSSSEASWRRSVQTSTRCCFATGHVHDSK